ncbi:hypothetical protein WJX82_007751 [Trebouxia sp. C0006]
MPWTKDRTDRFTTSSPDKSGNPEGHVLFHWVDTMEEHPVNTQPKPECMKGGHASKNGLRYTASTQSLQEMTADSDHKHKITMPVCYAHAKHVAMIGKISPIGSGRVRGTQEDQQGGGEGAIEQLVDGAELIL